MLLMLLGGLVFLVVLDRYFKRKGEVEFEALNDDCDAFWRIIRWWEQNPKKEIGKHPGGVALIQEAIAARKRFLATHPFVKDEGSVERLYALLN